MESEQFYQQPDQETLPLEKDALPRGADLARAVLNGTVSVEDIPGREMTDEEARIAHNELDKKFGVVSNWDTLEVGPKPKK